MPVWIILLKKDIMDDGEIYLEELEHEDVEKGIHRHASPMKDYRDRNTSSRSRKKSTEIYHKWKFDEYKDMPRGKSVQKSGDDKVENDRPRFICNHTYYSTTDRDARVSVKAGIPCQLNYSIRLTSIDIDSQVPKATITQCNALGSFSLFQQRTAQFL